MRHILLIISLLFAASLGKVSNTNMVVFRMDDLQDGWLSYAQIAVMDCFQDTQTPYTVGIIANHFGTDPTMVNYVKNALDNSAWDLEIADHGWNHEDFRNFSLADQTSLLANARTAIQNALGTHLKQDITTFIPPFNEFNANTLAALQATNYNVMSSQASYYADRSTYPSNGPIMQLPMAASSTDMADVYRIDSGTSFAEIQAQLASDGFSVVMMHFLEFTMIDNSGQRVLNQTSVDDLKTLINMCKSAGYQMATFKELRAAIAAQNGQGGSVRGTTAAAAPASVTSATVPKSSTSGRASTSGAVSASTTGVAATTGVVAASTSAAVSASTSGDFGSTTSSCSSGAANCVCRQDNSCDSGLTCKSGQCLPSSNIGNESTSAATSVVFSFVCVVFLAFL